jgi:Golgi phosphoprotein 3 (GPP34)
MSAGLSGTGLVADDLYLMAHHEVTGKPFVQPRALGTGLAGGLLAELMLGGSVVLRPDGVVAPGRIVPGDGIVRQVLDRIVGEHEAHPVREWLLFLAQTAAEDVARRLERSGYVTRADGRGRWRPGRWVPIDADWAFSPLIRVRSALDPARPLAAHEVVLAGLAVACGLDFRLAQYLPPPGRSLEEALGQLNRGLQELIAQTQAAIGSAVLAHRA